MRRGILRDKVYEWLYACTRLHGFEISNKHEGVRRVFGEGAHRISPVIMTRLPGPELSFLICIRINRVQDIYNPFARVAADFRSSNDSVAIRMQRLVAEAEPTAIESTEQLDLFLGRLGPQLEEVVIPFCDRVRDVEALDLILNETDLCHMMQPHRAMVALIAARLANNPRFEHLVATYEKEVRETTADFEQPQFFDLVAYLRGMA